MTGHVELRPEAMPLCGPADTIELIGAARGTGRHADCREWTYVAVHRGHGLWTHVYDVVQLPGPFGNEIRLIRVLPGDRRAEARSWALTVKSLGHKPLGHKPLGHKPLGHGLGAESSQGAAGTGGGRTRSATSGHSIVMAGGPPPCP